jgi:hypothetical protein
MLLAYSVSISRMMPRQASLLPEALKAKFPSIENLQHEVEAVKAVVEELDRMQGMQTQSKFRQTLSLKLYRYKLLSS